MIDASFTSVDRHTALKNLQAGKACLVPGVPGHFLESAGLKLGDPLELIPPGAPPGKVVSYEVVGAVSLPGWHWMTKMSGLRRQTTRTGAPVFAPITDVRRNFRIDRTNFVWLDTDGSVTPEQVEGSMQAIAETHGKSRFRVAGVREATSPHPRTPHSNSFRRDKERPESKADQKFGNTITHHQHQTDLIFSPGSWRVR